MPEFFASYFLSLAFENWFDGSFLFHMTYLHSRHIYFLWVIVNIFEYSRKYGVYEF